MSTSAPAFPPATASGTGLRNLPWLARFNLLLLAIATASLAALLWPHWRDNPDLSHGFLMPVIFFVLLHEARAGTPRYLTPSPLTHTASGALLVLGLLSLCASGLYAAAVDWSHAVVACTFALAFILLLGAALISFSSTSIRLIPFNWSACVALGLWSLSTPIPPGSYTRLTIGLQMMVTEAVLQALHLLGIAAERHGNIIELATTTVGVEDACSGVRSLISCVFAGFFFSATLVRRAWARGLIIALAAPVAIAMNFARSLTLTLLANRNVDISGAWHDATGFAVLGITAAFLGGLSLLLERQPKSQSPKTEAPGAVPSAANPPPARWRAHLPLALALTLAGACVAFFFANTRPSIRQSLPAPDLAAILPAEVPGWHVDTSQSIYQFTETLRTRHLAQRTYLRRTPAGVEQLTIYLAYWPAGQAPVSLVASHTPDACWPGSGWTSVPTPHSRETLALPTRTLAEAEARFFRNGDIPQHVWFWHLYDGRPILYQNPYSPLELLTTALRYGFTHDGDQLFVRISSNQPWSAFAAEPLLAEVFARLKPLGL